MSEANAFIPFLLDWLQQWWPALVLGFIVYFGLNFLLKPRSAQEHVDALQLSRNEIITTLSCTEHQANQLLAIYGGNSAKAIHEIKTGKAVMPGMEVSDVAIFGGELRSFFVEDQDFRLETHDGRSEFLDATADALLVVGVVDPEQRADAQGTGRADRGKAHAQLFWRRDEKWNRFLLTSTRLDYSVLGDKKENSAIRNFRLLIAELPTRSPNIRTDSSVQRLQDDLRAPLYASLADFEAEATQILRNWEF